MKKGLKTRASLRDLDDVIFGPFHVDDPDPLADIADSSEELRPFPFQLLNGIIQVFHAKTEMAEPVSDPDFFSGGLPQRASRG